MGVCWRGVGIEGRKYCSEKAFEGLSSRVRNVTFAYLSVYLYTTSSSNSLITFCNMAK
jgi:hypothetical protein